MNQLQLFLPCAAGVEDYLAPEVLRRRLRQPPCRGAGGARYYTEQNVFWVPLEARWQTLRDCAQLPPKAPLSWN